MQSIVGRAELGLGDKRLRGRGKRGEKGGKRKKGGERAKMKKKGGKSKKGREEAGFFWQVGLFLMPFL